MSSEAETIGAARSADSWTIRSGRHDAATVRSSRGLRARPDRGEHARVGEAAPLGNRQRQLLGTVRLEARYALRLAEPGRQHLEPERLDPIGKRRS